VFGLRNPAILQAPSWDPAAEDALYDSESMRRFAGIELVEDAVPDETTILRFRHLLEQHQLIEQIFGLIRGLLIFVWWNSTRMHVFTHLKKESEGKTGLGLYPDGMVEHDGHVGKLLDKLDELGIADNTLVMYSTDNGAECLSWPDGGWTPFRGEKDTNWEGGWRVPSFIRWREAGNQARAGGLLLAQPSDR